MTSSSSGSGIDTEQYRGNGATPAGATEGPAPAPPVAVPAAPQAVPPPPPPAAGVPLQRRVVWTEVPGYEGYQILLWLNYPRHWEEDIQGVNFRPAPDRTSFDEENPQAYLDAVKAWSAEREAAMRGALGRVVLAHNGWRDYPPPDGTGDVLPQPQDARFWDVIPQELANTILALRVQKAGDLPFSIQRRRRS